MCRSRSRLDSKAAAKHDPGISEAEQGKAPVEQVGEDQNLAPVLLSVAPAFAIYAQSPPQLQVEVGPNQQVRILGSGGEALRTLEKKLRWERVR